jgi:hypothetical protein
VQPHRADAVELGLFAGIGVGAFARLIALVEQLDLLELLECLAERRLRIIQLGLELARRAAQVLAPRDRRAALLASLLSSHASCRAMRQSMPIAACHPARRMDCRQNCGETPG